VAHRSTAGAGAAAASVHLRGTPAAPGIAIGPMWRYRSIVVEVAADDLGLDVSIRDAASTAVQQLESLATAVRARGLEGDAEILEAQAAMAADPALLDSAEELAAHGGLTTRTGRAQAVLDAAERLAGQLAELDDPLLAARAADVRDVGGRIGRVILGQAVNPPEPGSIAVADDLPPSVTVDLPPGSLAGIAMEGARERPTRPSWRGRSGSRPSSGWGASALRSTRLKAIPCGWQSTARPARS
jgi:phosphoenolpyruvate-protein kinase (PTS system EI component)